MSKLNPEMNEKVNDVKTSEELLELEGAKCCELEDDSLEDVSGGLVQLINPSSSRL